MARTNRRLLVQAYTLSQATGAIVEEKLAAIGVPSYLVGTLFQIRERAPVTPSAMAAATGTPTTTLRDNIQRLVDRGLVRRTSNPADGRSYFVELTARGEALALDAGDSLHQAYLALEASLPRPLDEYQTTLDELTQAVLGVLADTATEPA